MSYYLVAVGGIGSKCVEAFTHLCAAGFLPRGKEVNVLAVDPDTGNGNLKRAGALLSSYRDLQRLDLGDTELLSARIAHGDPFYWSPIAGNDTLDGIFDYYRMKGGNERSVAKLYDVLFSRAEGGQNLGEGYRGHPSIGAAVMAQKIDFEKVSSGENTEEGADLGKERLWSEIYSKIRGELRNGEKVKIFLFASVFGGTGASGFSTIATLFRNKFDDFFQKGNLRIGGALLLPYFYFPDMEDGSKEIFAASSNFLTNTQAALKYYLEKAGFEEIYKELYLIGDSSSQQVDFCEGGAKQENAANLVELYAAFAASAFFKKEEFSEGSTAYMCARQEEGKVRWGDLPGGEAAKQKIGQLSRFLFAYTYLVRPTLKEIAASSSGIANTPWYVDFFLKGEVSLKEAEPYLAALDRYTARFFEWLSQTHAVYGGRRVELTQSKAYQDPENLKYQDFPELIMDARKEERLKTNKVWDRLCGAKVKDKHASGLGKFLRALYDSVRAE